MKKLQDGTEQEGDSNTANVDHRYMKGTGYTTITII